MKVPLSIRPGIIMGSLGVLFLATVIATFVVRGPDRISTQSERTAPKGNPEEGRVAIERHGCGACHSIPGIQGANSRVGPRLDGIVEKSFIAGQLANTPENLARWIQNPQSISPETAMPDLGISDTEAQNIAAYLYSVTDEE